MVANPIAYCTGCKKRQEILHSSEVVVAMTNGSNRTALRGVCGVCSTNVFAFTATRDTIDESEKSFWRGRFSRFRWGRKD
tara:strand:+ start:289 stop:528 length:240 start_codon:yes stop_codon:yes gene_type:complete